MPTSQDLALNPPAAEFASIPETMRRTSEAQRRMKAWIAKHGRPSRADEIEAIEKAIAAGRFQRVAYPLLVPEE